MKQYKNDWTRLYCNKKNVKEHNPNRIQIFYPLHRILIIGGSGSGKTNTFLNLIKQENDDDYNIIDKIYLHVKDPTEANYQYLI